MMAMMMIDKSKTTNSETQMMGWQPQKRLDRSFVSSLNAHLVTDFIATRRAIKMRLDDMARATERSRRQVVHAVHLELLERNVLRRHAHEIGIHAAQHGDVAYDEDAASLPL